MKRITDDYIKSDYGDKSTGKLFSFIIIILIACALGRFTGLALLSMGIYF